MRIPKWGWKYTAAMVPVCAGVGVWNAIGREWWGVPLMAGAGVANVFIARRDYRQAHARPQPDYAEIRRLEIELGIREPDPPPLHPILGGQLSTRPIEWVRPAPPGPPLTPPTGRMPSTFGDYLAAQARPGPDQPARCPVCTRTHVRQCAG